MATGPHSVGIIMDGNRRWAKSRGVSSTKGHEAGFTALLSLLDAYRPLRDRFGTAHYYVYALSTENWNRPAEELASLLGIFERAFTELESRLEKFQEDGVTFRFLGEQEKFSLRLRELMDGIERKTAGGNKGTIAVCVSYGGRADILQAVNRLMEEGREVVTENDLEGALWSAGIPDPDLIIRTGGEERLSNFLTWQSIYSELVFTDTLWPDFSLEELGRIFEEYGTRMRRFGA